MNMLFTAHALSAGLGGLTIWVTLTSSAWAGPVGILVFVGIVGLQYYIGVLNEESNIKAMEQWLGKSHFGVLRSAKKAGGPVVKLDALKNESHYSTWSLEMAAYNKIMKISHN